MKSTPVKLVEAERRAVFCAVCCLRLASTNTPKSIFITVRDPKRMKTSSIMAMIQLSCAFSVFNTRAELLVRRLMVYRLLSAPLLKV